MVHRTTVDTTTTEGEQFLTNSNSYVPSLSLPLHLLQHLLRPWLHHGLGPQRFHARSVVRPPYQLRRSVEVLGGTKLPYSPFGIDKHNMLPLHINTGVPTAAAAAFQDHKIVLLLFFAVTLRCGVYTGIIVVIAADLRVQPCQKAKDAGLNLRALEEDVTLKFQPLIAVEINVPKPGCPRPRLIK